MTTCDFLVIGGGVIGLSIARDLRKRQPNARIIRIGKESSCGTHASGCNSGVLHAGFYYSPDSLQAKFTRLGNERLTAYCEEKRIPLNKCGKLVVAKDAGDLKSLDELLRRGQANGIALQDLTEARAKTIEPRVKTYQRALFSPHTSKVNPPHVVDAMEQDALREGIQIHFGTAYMSRQGLRVRTNHDPIEAGYVVNAAGLYTDKIAMGCGFSKHYRVLPFKGLYLYSNESPDLIRSNIYPVADLRNPFLGVHFTITAEDKTKIGQRRFLPHAGLPRHHSVPPPERLAPPATAGNSGGEASPCSPCFANDAWHLPHNPGSRSRTRTTGRPPHGARYPLNFYLFSAELPKRLPPTLGGAVFPLRGLRNR